MDHSDITKRLEKIDDLPTLPAIAMEVNKMLEDYDVSIRDLSNKIEKDQSIASKILKLVNSAFFGLSTKVSNIPHAMTLLGFNTVRNAVVSVSIIKSFKDKNNPGDFSMKDFWRHSVGVAVTSRHLSHILKIGVPDDCFIGGLLHDMGKLVIAQHFPDLFVTALNASSDNNISFYQAEKQNNPTDHARVGGYLAKKWRLPLGLSDAIKYHHLMSKNAQDVDLLSVVYSADLIYNNHQYGTKIDSDLPVNMSNRSRVLCCIGTKEEWFPPVNKEIEEACKFFLEDLD